ALNNMNKGPKPAVLGSNLGNGYEALGRFKKEVNKVKNGIGSSVDDTAEVITEGAGNPERQLLSGSEWNDYFKETYGSRKVRWKNKPVSYDRPSHFRKGVRDKVWENAKNTNGDVIDPVTEKVMDKSQTWDMGHKPGFEFRKHQQSAKERGISRKQFLDEYNKTEHYRPELPSSNRSHQGEDITDQYFGP
ncbi:HNH/ENDO VII family nuclease, partial [Clostridium sp. ZS2-4]|uniref:HNH/ENDO VII family nuclease n=1 Tax=Clostridium sp. ZS2-4 TaxID=2987703 RepID=UPI00227AB5EC